VDAVLAGDGLQAGELLHRGLAQALVALGYNERDANAALKALPPGVAVSEGIKLALKALSR
jgi:Holliday junction DNA helicase RuvA